MSAQIRVLLVEDSADDVMLVQRQLKREALEIEYRVETTKEGLRRAIEQFRPQVVLSDFTIPGFSGSEALRLAATLAPSVPFIFVSGTIGEEVAIECLQSGATDYVLKGNLRRLGPAVRRALRESEAREAARIADETRHRLVQILEATTDFVATKDLQRRLTFLNEAGCRLIGISREDAVGRQAEELYAPAARELVREVAVPAADKHGAWAGESALLARDGVEIPVSQVIVAHRGADGATQFYSTIARDIRERKAYEAQIVHMANTDALTGLPNRMLLGDRVAQTMGHSRRSGRPLALLSIDLDRFKLVNEGFGYAVGDEVLREIGALLRATVRDGDTVARLGADEFVVLLADLAHAEDGYAVAHKLLDAVSRPRLVAGKELRVTASIGAALFPADGDGFELLLGNAGAAVHRVKAQGGGSFQYYASGMTAEALERIALERGLQDALEQDALALHFQPLYDLRTRRATGVETLLRWFGKDGKAVSPARFIPIAEETGLIRPIGEWVLARTCRTVLEWGRQGEHPPRAGINVSPRQLHDGTFPGIVKRVLVETGFPASRLELEITESALMESGDNAVRTMAALKSLGVTIAVDDFGTGYSSLSYLSRMPIDRLKVDLGFVHRMTMDKQDAAIVQAVIWLGHALGLQVVAEGVETEEQLALLTKMDCDEVQGYLFARPASAEQIRPLFDQGGAT